jgi:hypothetical protein
LVEQALHKLQPDEVLVDQPQTTSELLLPQPQWVQSVLDHQQCLQPGQQQGQQRQQHVQALAAELFSSMPAAKVGKDIMDPFESFGYYSGLDYFKQPGSLAEVLQLCGYLPGQEVVAAGQYALAHGGWLAYFETDSTSGRWYCHFYSLLVAVVHFPNIFSDCAAFIMGFPSPEFHQAAWRLTLLLLDHTCKSLLTMQMLTAAAAVCMRCTTAVRCPSAVHRCSPEAAGELGAQSGVKFQCCT